LPSRTELLKRCREFEYIVFVHVKGGEILGEFQEMKEQCVLCCEGHLLSDRVVALGRLRDHPAFQDTTKSLIREVASRCRDASRSLLSIGTEGRQNILRALAKNLIKMKDEILAANAKDMEIARRNNYAYIKRLRLTEDKLRTLEEGTTSIAAAVDPVGLSLKKTLLAQGLILEKISAPFGVILVIFESRPDVLPQVAALGIKSGNGVLMKGGKESINTCRSLNKVVQMSIEEASKGEVAPDLISMVEGREEIKEILKLDDMIDLCIPRGSNSMVKYIENNTNIPVLGHSEGLCHIYVDNEVDLQMAIRVLIDAKTDYPAACNAVETILLHSELFPNSAKQIVEQLQNAGVEVYGCPDTCRLLSNESIKACDGYQTEYCAMQVTVKRVNDITEGIEHINTYGSGHTESILTTSMEKANHFLAAVDSGSVYHNCSTRFADGFRYGLGAEVGISTKKVHARGPVGVMGLESTKYLLRSDSNNGHAASDFKQGGDFQRKWIHTTI